MTLEIGDVVRLKSGGPNMTVDANLPPARDSDAPHVRVVWTKDEEIKYAALAVASLISVS